MLFMETHPLIVTHAEDPDGIISHALLLRALDIHDQTLSPENHHFLRYDRLVEQFESIGDLLRDSKKDLYIADIGLNPALAAVRNGHLVPEILQNARSTTWIDHHANTEIRIGLLNHFGVDVVYNNRQCAGQQTQRYFNLNSPYEILLGKIAQAHDYKKLGVHHPNITLGDELQAVISYANASLDFNMLAEFTAGLRDENVIQGERLTSDWEDIVIDYEHKQQQAFQDLENSIESETIAGHRVLWAVASPYLSAKPAPRYMKQYYSDKCDFYIVIFESPTRNHIFEKSPHVLFPVEAMAQSLGGGGRGDGGGFSVPYDTTEETIPQIKELVREKIEHYSRSA